MHLFNCTIVSVCWEMERAGDTVRNNNIIDFKVNGERQNIEKLKQSLQGNY